MRISSCRSSVTSCRNVGTSTAMPWHLRFVGFLLLRARSQLIPDTPQRGEEVVMDHLSEHLDRRSLRPDDLVANDARDDLVMADAPHRDAFVPLDQRLGELVKGFLLAPLDVHLDDIEAGSGDRVLEGLAERRRDATHLAESRRIEAAAVPEHPPDGLVLPRRHLLEHVELAHDEL